MRAPFAIFALWIPLAIGIAATTAPNLRAQSTRDCQRQSFGLRALPDLIGSSYQGFAGGLYPGERNDLPPAHLAAGLQHATAILPRDAAGQLDPQGRIVLLSIGMSNATQEFSTWRSWSELDPLRHRSVVVVDGAQGGQDARLIANPNAAFWNVVDQRLTNAGVSANQVQVIWLKEAMAAPSTTQFPAHMIELQGFLADIARNLHDKFPFAQLCFLSSRSYGGYSTNPNRTEPLSYETGFAVRELIAAQLQGDPTLNHDPTQGVVRAPWLAWGPYLWTDGIVPRNDGLTWRCVDTVADGVHPSASGRLAVADLLDQHWKQHPCTSSWYLGPQAIARAGALNYGNPCASATGEPRAFSQGAPRVGNANFGLRIDQARPSTPCTLVMALGRSRIALTDLCDLWIDQPFAAFATNTNGAGIAQLAVPIPLDPLLVGLRVFHQWWIADPTGAQIPGIGTLAASSGQLIQVGL